MLFQWLVALIAIIALAFAVVSDYWTGKNKHSRYFAEVQKPSSKPQREPNIPSTSKHDSFYSKLNTL